MKQMKSKFIQMIALLFLSVITVNTVRSRKIYGLTDTFKKGKELFASSNQWLTQSINLKSSQLLETTLRPYISWIKNRREQFIKEAKQYFSANASIRNRKTISESEEEFTKKRLNTIKSTFETLFEVETPIKIAFVGTGGGYRAMILTAGYMEALERLGIINLLSYCVGLSGSTWFIAPWIERGMSVKDYNELLRNRMQTKELYTKSAFAKLNATRISNFIIEPKIFFSQPLSLVDIYGELLRIALFGDLPNKQLTLPAQQKKIENGTAPLPLYTAVSYHKKNKEDKTGEYNWYEFNPFEITNLEYSLAFPSYAWGWRFNKGTTSAYEPITPLATLLGIFGSAFTVNLLDLERQSLLVDGLKEATTKTSSPFEKIIGSLKLKAVETALQISSVSTLRASPLQIKNPFLNYHEKQLPAWLTARDYLTFVDAGIDYNIPLKPVLCPERGVDLIIVGESSGNAETSEELKKALIDAKKTYGYMYQRVEKQSNKTMALYRCLNSDTAPVIVYFNFITNSELLEKIKNNTELSEQEKIIYEAFTKKDCLKNYCDTFNFNYTTDQFDELKHASLLSIVSNKNSLLNLIKETIEERQEVSNRFVAPVSKL